MAAIMTRRKNDIKEIKKLMDECNSLGIKALGPDVNESFSNFGVNKKGEVRFGLAAIKGMGEAAAEAIIEERHKNGPYKDIYDFAQRVSFSQVNRRCYESLVLSGAFDSFGIAREQYMEVVNNQGDKFLDTLTRFGQNYQNALAEAQTSLFGFDGFNETVGKPPVPKNYTKLSSIELLNRERDLVGIYLSAHPLDDYSFILDKMCNTVTTELEDKEGLSQKDSIVFGGIVSAVRTGTTKTGKPYGIVTLEDYSGSGEVAVFDDWGMWSGYFVVGVTLYIKATCKKRYPTSKYYEFRLGSVSYMSDIKEKCIDKFTISVKSDNLTEELVDDLTTVLDANEGDVPLYFSVYYPKYKNTMMLRAKSKGVNVNHKLVSFIDSKEELAYSVN